ncbi:PT domain-containing protein [Frankia sp. CeD]|uniref:PT domain-containing protein n=1 Tax=Frankia sp. CeD TaxID=258230 RepID=UPI00126A3CBB
MTRGEPPRRLPVHPPVHPSNRPSTRPTVRPPVHPSVQPSNRPTVQPSNRPHDRPGALSGRTSCTVHRGVRRVHGGGRVASHGRSGGVSGRPVAAQSICIRSITVGIDNGCYIQDSGDRCRCHQPRRYPCP